MLGQVWLGFISWCSLKSRLPNRASVVGKKYFRGNINKLRTNMAQIYEIFIRAVHSVIQGT